MLIRINGALLRKLRLEKGYTQRQIAQWLTEQTGTLITVQTIRNLEAGRCGVDAGELARLQAKQAAGEPLSPPPATKSRDRRPS